MHSCPFVCALNKRKHIEWIFDEFACTYSFFRLNFDLLLLSETLLACKESLLWMTMNWIIYPIIRWGYKQYSALIGNFFSKNNRPEYQMNDYTLAKLYNIPRFQELFSTALMLISNEIISHLNRKSHATDA